MLEGATGSENREVPTFREARQRHDTNVTPWLEQACEADDCRLASSEGSRGSLGRLRPTEGPGMREWEGVSHAPPHTLSLRDFLSTSPLVSLLLTSLAFLLGRALGGQMWYCALLRVPRTAPAKYCLNGTDRLA